MPNNAIKFAPYGRRTSRSVGRLWQTLAEMLNKRQIELNPSRLTC